MSDGNDSGRIAHYRTVANHGRGFEMTACLHGCADMSEMLLSALERATAELRNVLPVHSRDLIADCEAAIKAAKGEE